MTLKNQMHDQDITRILLSIVQQNGAIVTALVGLLDRDRSPAVTVSLETLLQPPTASDVNAIQEILRVLRGNDDEEDEEPVNTAALRQATEPAHSSENCAICRESMEGSDACVRIRRCGHVFHGERCLFNWFNRNSTCPTCRQNVTN